MDFKIAALLLVVAVVVLESAVVSNERVSFDDNKAIRVKRQDDATTTTRAPPRRPRPSNIFSLFSTLLAETRDDTRRAFGEIRNLFNAQFTTGPPAPSTTPIPGNGTDDASSTTEPYRISRDEFNGILMSNLRGIGTLFRKEVRNAVRDSAKNVREFGREFGSQLRPYVEIRTARGTYKNRS